jgi:hypothetical protein
MKQVWKFKLYPGSQECTEMPEGAEILSVAFQGGDLCMWARVDPEAILVKRSFTVYGTGHDIEYDNLRFYGTVFTGSLVFHVFEFV